MILAPVGLQTLRTRPGVLSQGGPGRGILSPMGGRHTPQSIYPNSIALIPNYIKTSNSKHQKLALMD